MNIALLAVMAVAGALIWNFGKTAKAANDLIAVFKTAKIHKFASGGDMIIRVFVDFTNLHETAIILQNAYLQIKLDGLTLGTCNVNNISIPKGTTEKYFELVMPWKNLGVAAVLKVTQWFSSGTLTPPQKCTITGQIKAEGVIMKVNKEIPFVGNLS